MEIIRLFFEAWKIEEQEEDSKKYYMDTLLEDIRGVTRRDRWCSIVAHVRHVTLIMIMR